jgi:hypothetical protein
MKMRKLLPVLIIAVGSVFLLSGCDAILDAIFQNNQITVDVSVSSGYALDYASGNGTVTLTLTDVTSGTPTTVASTRTGFDSVSSHFVFAFTKLKSDTFTVNASYTSAYYTSPLPMNSFLDPSNNALTQITMPYTNSGDSTGRSVYLKIYF